MSKLIEDLLFDITHKIEDCTIEHICDLIEEIGFLIEEVENFDINIYINFTLKNLNNFKSRNTLKINRMDKKFTINSELDILIKEKTLIDYDEKYFSSLDELISYIKKLKIDLLNYMERICIENNLYDFRGLIFNPKF